MKSDIFLKATPQTNIEFTYGYCTSSCIKVPYLHIKGKGKAVPLHAWTGPEGSRKFPDFMTTV